MKHFMHEMTLMILYVSLNIRASYTHICITLQDIFAFTAANLFVSCDHDEIRDIISLVFTLSSCQNKTSHDLPLCDVVIRQNDKLTSWDRRVETDPEYFDITCVQKQVFEMVLILKNAVHVIRDNDNISK